jgi:hypothetical protein
MISSPVRGLAPKLVLVNSTTQQPHIRSSALASPKIAAALHQGLVRVVELGVLHRDGVEPVVFRGLDACVNVESGWGRKVISRG